MGVLLTISGVYPGLTAAERRIADVVLRDPTRVRGWAIDELARLVGVSQTTVNRFCRTLGFDGYRDFKLDLAADPSTRAGHESMEPPLRLAGLLGVGQEALICDIQALQDLQVSLDYENIASVANIIGKAENVGVFGAGSSLPIAMDLAYRLKRSGLRCHYSPDSHEQAMNAALLSPSDAAVAISYSGESRETLDVMRAAKETGAATICITCFAQSQLARTCETVLLSSIRKTYNIQEQLTVRIAQLALCDILSTMICHLNEAKVRQISERIDRVVEDKRGKGNRNAD